MGLNSFIKTLLGLSRHSPAQTLEKTGVLQKGKNSDLSALQIHLSEAPEKGQVLIGDDCLLHGKIILHGKDARVKIGNGVFIGEGSEIICRKSIEIGNDVMISWGVSIVDTNAHSLNSEERKNDVRDWKKGPAFKNWDHVEAAPVKIKNKAWLGFRSIVLKGTSIGEGAVIGAGSVVVKDVNDYTVAGGNPAQTIKTTS